MRVVIVGAGILGAALAHRLSESGAEVVVLDHGTGATAASFGWINASFFLDRAHFELRQEGIGAWRRLGPLAGLSWQGCLCWENTGDAMVQQAQELTDLGYDVEVLDRTEVQRLEPDLRAPEQALRFAAEGVANPLQTCENLFAKSRNARVVRGVRALHLVERAGRIAAVRTDVGDLEGDAVVVAAGIGTPELLGSVGVEIGLLHRPGLMMRTRPVDPILTHVVASETLEFRQDAQGHIWAPTTASHQGDAGETAQERPDVLADSALAQLQSYLPGRDLGWDLVMRAMRPVPLDDRPVFGATGPDGLFVAVMHSGVTLAAITAELLTPLVTRTALTNSQKDLMAPYTPDRFRR